MCATRWQVIATFLVALVSAAQAYVDFNTLAWLLTGTSPTTRYTTPEHVEHIVYVGNDQAIRELF